MITVTITKLKITNVNNCTDHYNDSCNVNNYNDYYNYADNP